MTGRVGGTVENGNADDENLPAAKADVAAPTPTTTVSGTPAKLKLACTTKRANKAVSVTCTATGADAKSKGIAVRLRLVKGSSVLATARTTLKSGRVKATLRAKHALSKGKRYTLRIAVTHKGGVLGLSRTV